MINQPTSIMVDGVMYDVPETKADLLKSVRNRACWGTWCTITNPAISCDNCAFGYYNGAIFAELQRRLREPEGMTTTKGKNDMHNEQAGNEQAPYGYCPHCGARVKTRERSPNGNDTCMMGCVYPSFASVATPTQGLLSAMSATDQGEEEPPKGLPELTAMISTLSETVKSLSAQAGLDRGAMLHLEERISALEEGRDGE